jgi:hypothetical protein
MTTGKAMAILAVVIGLVAASTYMHEDPFIAALLVIVFTFILFFLIGLNEWVGVITKGFQSTRVKFAMENNGIEDELAQAMAEIGFTVEPQSRIGNSFTFSSATTGSRLVVTKIDGGIVVVGAPALVTNLAGKLGIAPQTDA